MRFGHLVSTLASFAAVAMAVPMPAANDLPAHVLESAELRHIQERANDAAPVPFTAYQQYQFPAQLAQSAYCGQPVGSKIGDATIRWIAGDGRNVPMTFVAYSPSRGVIVSHQGTNTSSFSSILNDADFFLDAADSRLSYLGSGVEIHGGFQDTWLETADQILTQVKSALTANPSAPILTVGHSLGASISLLDALYLKKQLPSNKVSSVTFGMPRSGNPAFANAVDANLPGFVHINNGRDPVPRLPGGGLGFQQPSGEIWINPADGLSAVSCPGQENENCILSVNPLQFDVDDHTGTYFKVSILFTFHISRASLF